MGLLGRLWCPVRRFNSYSEKIYKPSKQSDGMKSVINKVFSDEMDEEVHTDFVKYSRGVFENRYLIEGKKQKDKWSIKTSCEFANFFVRAVLENASGELNIKGIIVSTSDLRSDCEFEIDNVKRYMGIKQLVLNCSTTPEKMLSLMDKHPRAFYALSFSSGDYNLKIKAKPPKSGKPGNKTKKGEGPKADFCSLKTSNKEIIEDLFFDVPEFKEIKINHTIEIKDIEIPSGITTPEEMRKKAKRKGIIKRKSIIDGKEEITEKEFVG